MGELQSFHWVWFVRTGFYAHESDFISKPNRCKAVGLWWRQTGLMPETVQCINQDAGISQVASSGNRIPDLLCVAVMGWERLLLAVGLKRFQLFNPSPMITKHRVTFIWIARNHKGSHKGLQMGSGFQGKLSDYILSGLCSSEPETTKKTQNMGQFSSI